MPARTSRSDSVLPITTDDDPVQHGVGQLAGASMRSLGHSSSILRTARRAGRRCSAGAGARAGSGAAGRGRPSRRAADRAARWPARGRPRSARRGPAASGAGPGRRSARRTASSASWEVRCASMTCRYIAVGCPRRGAGLGVAAADGPRRAASGVQRPQRERPAATVAAASRTMSAVSCSISRADRVALTTNASSSARTPRPTQTRSAAPSCRGARRSRSRWMPARARSARGARVGRPAAWVEKRASWKSARQLADRPRVDVEACAGSAPRTRSAVSGRPPADAGLRGRLLEEHPAGDDPVAHVGPGERLVAAAPGRARRPPGRPRCPAAARGRAPAAGPRPRCEANTMAQQPVRGEPEPEEQRGEGDQVLRPVANGPDRLLLVAPGRSVAPRALRVGSASTCSASVESLVGSSPTIPRAGRGRPDQQERDPQRRHHDGDGAAQARGHPVTVPSHALGHRSERVMVRTSRAASSSSSVRSPRSTYPISSTCSRMVRPSLSAALATLAASS